MLWVELQRFFASGNALYIAPGLDLIDVAADFSLDDSATLKPLIEAGKMAPVTDMQALEWYENEALMWAVVVAPWVLVQPLENNSTTERGHANDSNS